jgi:hypothetical protein
MAAASPATLPLWKIVSPVHSDEPYGGDRVITVIVAAATETEARRHVGAHFCKPHLEKTYFLRTLLHQIICGITGDGTGPAMTLPDAVTFATKYGLHDLVSPLQGLSLEGLEFQMDQLEQTGTTDAEKEAAFATLFQNVQDGNDPLTGLSAYSLAYSSEDPNALMPSDHLCDGLRLMKAPITRIGTSVHTVPTIVSIG